jgi:hypothetical protein
MLHHIERLRRGLWVLKQPLTQIPRPSGVPISDLFIWRNSEDWKTFFELIDISGLFVDREDTCERYVTLVFFDSDGILFLEERLKLIRNQRQTIDLSGFISKSESPVGTFCIFHSHTPEMVTRLGSYITERGYVSYCYKGAPLRAYVHGNLDAIALQSANSLELLGSTSLRAREYRLQYALQGPALYELAIVNPSSRDQHFYCQVFSTLNNEILEIQEIQLRPRGSYVFLIQIKQSQIARIIISSHLVMARPLVFRINNRKMDVFHG